MFYKNSIFSKNKDWLSSPCVRIVVASLEIKNIAGRSENTVWEKDTQMNSKIRLLNA